MAVQSSITNDPQVGAPGLIYDTGPHDIQTYIAQENIPFGCYVKISGQYVELPDTIAEVQGKGGIALRDDAHITGQGYLAGEEVPVMTFGRAWVATEQAIAAQAQPFVRYATGTGTQQGGWRNDVDSTTAIQPSNVHCYRGVGGAGLAVMEIARTGSV